MISIENKLSKLSKDNLQKICKMMKKKHMQDDSKQRLMEILMKPLGKKYKMWTWFSPEPSEPSEPYIPRDRPKTPKSNRRGRWSKRWREHPNRLVDRQRAEERYAEWLEAKEFEENTIWQNKQVQKNYEEIALYVILILKYYSTKYLNAVTERLSEYDLLLDYMNNNKERIRTGPINRDTINSIVDDLKKITNSDQLGDIMDKTNSIILYWTDVANDRDSKAGDEHEFAGVYLLDSYISDLDSAPKLNGYISEYHTTWAPYVLVTNFFDRSVRKY